MRGLILLFRHLSCGQRNWRAIAPGGPVRGRRQDRGDRIGRGIRGNFLKGFKIWGFLPYPGDRLCLVQRISAFSLCCPEMKQVTDKCPLLGRGYWKRDRESSGEDVRFVLDPPPLLQNYSLFMFRFATPGNPFPNSFCVWFHWG